MNAPGIGQLQDMIARLIGLVVGLGFVALTVMLVIGGIKFLTSGGDQKAITSARQTLTWAILGIIALAIAWIALLLVGAVTGIEVTNFNLCFFMPGNVCPNLP